MSETQKSSRKEWRAATSYLAFRAAFSCFVRSPDVTSARVAISWANWDIDPEVFTVET